MDKFDHIHIADRRAVFERLARSAVVHENLSVDFAVGRKAVLFEKHLYVALERAVEHGRRHLPAESLCDKPEVNLEHLSDVHTRRHAERI